ncbi:thermonuclease family protein [Staphylococcus pseudoxylosus]|uniref:thermonuclease family protein n=1 Tax=Staphylococcus pseudoxylosus TaxID=2282419 RepID=UPI00398AA8ED
MIKEQLYIFKAHCYNVVDGDTIDVMIDFGFDVWADRRLRLLNVDTPERGQENYSEATEFVKEKVLENDIMVQTYKDDSFGKYLATVYYDDGKQERILNNDIKNSGLIKPNSKWN